MEKSMSRTTRGFEEDLKEKVFVETLREIEILEV